MWFTTLGHSVHPRTFIQINEFGLPGCQGRYILYRGGTKKRDSLGSYSSFRRPRPPINRVQGLARRNSSYYIYSSQAEWLLGSDRRVINLDEKLGQRDVSDYLSRNRSRLELSSLYFEEACVSGNIYIPYLLCWEKSTKLNGGKLKIGIKKLLESNE